MPSHVKYKFNDVDCLIDRAYKINSSYCNLCTEFQNLRRFFSRMNIVFLWLINPSKKLYCIYEPISTVATVPKQIISFQVPCMSDFLNKQLNSEVVRLVSKNVPQVNLCLIFNYPNSISKFLICVKQLRT